MIENPLLEALGRFARHSTGRILPLSTGGLRPIILTHVSKRGISG
jgi:hypothetical protein